MDIAQAHTVSHCLFHDRSTLAYISVLVTFLMQVFLSVLTPFHPSHTSLSSLSLTFILDRDYCFITPSGTWLLFIFTLFALGSGNETGGQT